MNFARTAPMTIRASASAQLHGIAVALIAIGCTASHSKIDDAGAMNRGDRDAGDTPMDAGVPLDSTVPPDSDASTTTCSPFPIEGAACANEGESCGDECPSACDWCNAAYCSGGHWRILEAFPAPCFDCGAERCVERREICSAVADFAIPHCAPTPATCEDGVATCACVTLDPEYASISCTESAPGQVHLYRGV